jgi:transposase
MLSGAAMGRPPEQRRLIRQRLARPVMDDLAAFLDASLATIRSDLARAIRYARSRWTALTRYLDDGTLEISNNAAERAIRPLAMRGSLYTPSSSI